MLFFHSICISYGQEAEYYRVKKNTGKVIVTPYMNSEIVILRLTGLFDNARKIIYYDTINGYQVEVQKSMEIKETNSVYNFCFSIPREKGNDNVICINSSPKEVYKGLDDFKDSIIENPEYLDKNSKTWLWGQNSKLLSVIHENFDSYDSYRALILVNERRILGQFIILETDKSYLWINYVADEETFDSDISIFSKFLKKFEILE